MGRKNNKKSGWPDESHRNRRLHPRPHRRSPLPTPETQALNSPVRAKSGRRPVCNPGHSQKFQN